MKFKADIAKAFLNVAKSSVGTAKFIDDLIKFATENLKSETTDSIDMALLEQLCNLVEIQMYNKSNVADEKINKKDVVLKLYFALKPSANNETDKNRLERAIENLHNMGHIKSIGYWKMLCFKLVKLFKKKSYNQIIT
jgi:hypothetical protein